MIAGTLITLQIERYGGFSSALSGWQLIDWYSYYSVRLMEGMGDVYLQGKSAIGPVLCHKKKKNSAVVPLILAVLFISPRCENLYKSNRYLIVFGGECSSSSQWCKIAKKEKEIYTFSSSVLPFNNNATPKTLSISPQLECGKQTLFKGKGREMLTQASLCGYLKPQRLFNNPHVCSRWTQERRGGAVWGGGKIDGLDREIYPSMFTMTFLCHSPNDCITLPKKPALQPTRVICPDAVNN